MTGSTPETPRHKVFISYHHAGDEEYKKLFVAQFRSSAFDDYSVRPGEIPENNPTEAVRQIIRDQKIRNSTVTIVLIGADTWKRKHVDWEIQASLRDTPSNDRNGLLGILLPTYSTPQSTAGRRYSIASSTPSRAVYCPHNIPPRLADNVGPPFNFAIIRPYPTNAAELSTWIHEAFKRRNENPAPNNARVLFADNRAGEQDFWPD